MFWVLILFSVLFCILFLLLRKKLLHWKVVHGVDLKEEKAKEFFKLFNNFFENEFDSFEEFQVWKNTEGKVFLLIQDSLNELQGQNH